MIDSLAHKYSLRCAHLLETKPPERKKIFYDVKHFYGARSKIVHGSSREKKKAFDKINLQEIENYIRKSVKIFIEKMNKQRMTQEDVIEDLDYG